MVVDIKCGKCGENISTMQTIQFIQVTPEQLQEAIIDGVNSKLEDLKKNFQPNSTYWYLLLH